MHNWEWVENEKDCNEEIRVAAQLRHAFISAGFFYLTA